MLGGPPDKHFSNSELAGFTWQSLPEYVRKALEQAGVDWPTWKRAGEMERWHMLKRAIGN